MNEGIRLALFGCEHFPAPNQGCIVGPTFTILRDVVEKEFFKFCPQEAIERYSLSERVLDFRNGSRILFRSADAPERLRGLDLEWFYLDEAAITKPDAYQILLGRIAQKSGCGFLSSTPKGYNWLYDEFVKRAEEGDPDYQVFYWTSADNPYFPKSEIERLKRSYTDEFYQQEILGKFVRFTGLVYPDFSRAENVVDSIDMTKIKRVLFGLDFGFRNETAILVAGFDSDDNVYVLDEFYRKGVLIRELGLVLKRMVETYKPESIYADPSEPNLIAELNRMNLRVEKGNNDVRYGINKVSEKIKSMKVKSSCVNFIREIENYRYPQTTAEKTGDELPVKKNDHLCFIAGTLVLTDRGHVPIEMLNPSFKALTRSGFRKIKAIGSTGMREIYEVVFSDGRKLFGSGDHPILVEGKGFVKIKDLEKNFICFSAQNNLWHPSPKLSSSKESNSEDTPILKKEAKESISEPTQIISKKASAFSIRKFGKMLTEKFQRAIASITKISILLTMNFPISNSWILKNICPFTPKTIMLKTRRKSKNALTESGPSLKLGMLQRKEESGTRNTVKNAGRTGKNEPSSAKTAEKSFTPKLTIANSAAANANLHGEGNRESTTKRESALSAAKNLPSTDIPKLKPVRVVAVRSLHLKRKVYNLSVDNCHEFFANGILVSNCDALRYILSSDSPKFCGVVSW